MRLELIIKKQVKGSRRKAQGFFTLDFSPNPEINAIWHKEAQKRWQAYKAGELETVSYETVMQKYQ